MVNTVYWEDVLDAITEAESTERVENQINKTVYHINYQISQKEIVSIMDYMVRHDMDVKSLPDQVQESRKRVTSKKKFDKYFWEIPLLINLGVAFLVLQIVPEESHFLLLSLLFVVITTTIILMFRNKRKKLKKMWKSPGTAEEKIDQMLEVCAKPSFYTFKKELLISAGICTAIIIYIVLM